MKTAPIWLKAIFSIAATGLLLFVWHSFWNSMSGGPVQDYGIDFWATLGATAAIAANLNVFIWCRGGKPDCEDNHVEGKCVP